MSAPNRAGWGKFSEFSQKERDALRFILRRRDSEKIDPFLNQAQVLVCLLRSDYEACGIEPPEPAAKAKRLLERIANLAEQLNDAINELDMTKSADEIPASRQRPTVSPGGRLFTLVLTRFLSVVYAVLGRAKIHPATDHHSPASLHPTKKKDD